jgi:hypothetical protein
MLLPCHANAVEWMTDAKRLTQTWLNMAKAVESRLLTSTRLLYAKPVTTSLTKEVNYPRTSAKKCGLWLT